MTLTDTGEAVQMPIQAKMIQLTRNNLVMTQTRAMVSETVMMVVVTTAVVA